ncbi:MAG: hypothetical protein MUF53_06390 [Gemmatimonadaceae bacterium]|jgi:hypothetical protein|nr:hypothetical protein [Gemmatimonadaceae bacterium]
MKKPPTPYKLLPPEKRAALITEMLTRHPTTRAAFIARLTSRKGGFRAQTFQPWPADKLAREVVRVGAESVQDEVDLLQLLYVELEPAIQITFLDAAGVRHTQGTMPEELSPPFADEAAVRRAVATVVAQHGEAADHYLLTLVTYARAGWPGIVEAVTAVKGTPGG